MGIRKYVKESAMFTTQVVPILRWVIMSSWKTTHGSSFGEGCFELEVAISFSIALKK